MVYNNHTVENNILIKNNRINIYTACKLVMIRNTVKDTHTFVRGPKEMSFV